MSDPPERAERRPEPFNLAIAVGFVVFLYAAWTIAFLEQLDVESVLRYLSSDDAFYYLEVARHVARGDGFTFDGLHTTNGFHPLWLGMLVPVHWATSGPESALWLAKILEFSLLAIAASLVVYATWRARWRLGAVSIIGPALLVIPAMSFGLEAAAQAAILAGFLPVLVAQFESPSTTRHTIALSLLLALLPWVRLETIAFGVGLIVLTGCYYEWGLDTDTRPPLWASGVALVGSTLAYFGFQSIWFGTPVPVSGRVKTFYSEHAWTNAGGFDLWTNASTIASQPLYLVGLCETLVLVGAVAWLWSNADYRCRHHSADHAIDVFMLSIAGAHVARTGFSALFTHPDFAHYGWYFVPMLLLSCLLGPYLLHRALLKRQLDGGSDRMRLRWTPLAVGVVATAILFVAARPFGRLQDWKSSNDVDWEIASYRGTQWMNRNLPEKAIVGSTDAGVIGFFAKQRVVNLDGLINSHSYFQHMRDGRVDEWLSEHPIDYFANVVDADLGCDVLRRRTRQPSLSYRTCKVVHRGPTNDAGHAFTVYRYRF